MRMLRLFRLAGIALALLAPAGAALPQEAPAMTPRLLAGRHFLATWHLAGTECMCRANGSFYHEGELACIRGVNGPRLARCSKVINMLHWDTTDAPCPES